MGCQKSHSLCHFFKNSKRQWVEFGGSGWLAKGVLVGSNKRLVKLKEVKVYYFDCKTVSFKTAYFSCRSIVFWGVPAHESCDGEYLILSGRIVEAENDMPLKNLVLEISRRRKPNELLGYSYTNLEGQYMLPINRSSFTPTDQFIIRVLGSSGQELRKSNLNWDLK